MFILQALPDVNALISSTDVLAIKILLAIIAVIMAVAVVIAKVLYNEYRSNKKRKERIEDEEREARAKTRADYSTKLGEIAAIVAGIEGWSSGISKQIGEHSHRLDDHSDKIERIDRRLDSILDK